MTSEIPLHIRRAITRAYPDLSGGLLRQLGDGQFSLAVLLDETLVLRFPRHPFGVAKLRREADLLTVIARNLPVPVSAPIRIELDPGPPNAFVAHHLVPGTRISRGMLDGLESEVVQQAGSATGTFLAALHETDPVVVPPSVPRRDVRAFADDLRAATVETLWQRMNARGRRRAEAELAALELIANREQVLCHCDIGGNLIYDQPGSQLGVVDFGEAMVTSPVLDVASLSVLGVEFMAAAARRYPLLSDCLDEARAVRATFALQDALGGAAQDDWAYVDRILHGYQLDARE